MSTVKKAFTLAEVLITMAIIGIVAALTIPTLINDYQKKQTVSKLKRMYSVISNASNMSEIENGPISTWDFEIAKNDAGPFVNEYYAPYLRVEAIYAYNDFENKYNYQLKNLFDRILNAYEKSIVLLLSDGSLIIFDRLKYSGIDNPKAYMWLYADINGISGPNKVGKDIFIFDLMDWAKNDYYVSFYKCHGCNTREQLINGQYVSEEDAESNRSGMGCSKDNKYGYYSGFYCGALIQMDGWEIKDDYPW